MVQAIDHRIEKEKSKLEAKLKEQQANEEAAPKNDDDMEIDEEERDDNIQEQSTEEDREGGEQQESPPLVFLSHVGASFKERLLQIVQPLADEEFHQRSRGHIIQKKIRKEERAERLAIAQEQAALKAQEDAKRRIELERASGMNTDYDDHELLDQEASKRARELRAQVRAKAEEAQKQQAAVLERAIRLAQCEVRLLTRDILLEKEEDTTMMDCQQKQQSTAAKAKQQRLKQMENSLKSLTESLSSTVDASLPKNLQDLRDTIQNIQKSLQRKEQPLSLSQTEQAIMSRENEGAYNKLEILDEEDDDDDKDDPILRALEGFSDKGNPEFLLADFLCKY